MHPRWALLAAALIGTLVAAPVAHASGRGSLNGTFTATSNGEWARTNDVFHNERSLPLYITMPFKLIKVG